MTLINLFLWLTIERLNIQRLNIQRLEVQSLEPDHAHFRFSKVCASQNSYRERLSVTLLFSKVCASQNSYRTSFCEISPKSVRPNILVARISVRILFSKVCTFQNSYKTSFCKNFILQSLYFPTFSQDVFL